MKKRVIIGLLALCALVAVSFVPTSLAQVSTNPLEAIGAIDTPPGVQTQIDRAGGGADIPIVYFISMLIQIFTVVMGVWVMFNFILAGYTYVGSGGDAGAHEKVRQNITQSVIGLILIVIAFTITGLISLVFFGDPGFLLNPTIPSQSL